jgi:S-DNA-T family DNA segregation ATPase FtsK/SpoIIIE
MPAPVIIDHTLDNAPAQAAPVESPEFVKTTLRLVSDKETPSKKEPGHTATFNPATGGNNFVLPTTDLLQFPTKIKSQRMNKDITDKVRILEETLENFGVKARVTQVSRGPSITRYEIQPPPGIRVTVLSGWQMTSPFHWLCPGTHRGSHTRQAAVGVEVPNEEIASVTLREVLETELFQNSHLN